MSIGRGINRLSGVIAALDDRQQSVSSLTSRELWLIVSELQAIEDELIHGYGIAEVPSHEEI